MLNTVFLGTYFKALKYYNQSKFSTDLFFGIYAYTSTLLFCLTFIFTAFLWVGVFGNIYFKIDLYAYYRNFASSSFIHEFGVLLLVIFFVFYCYLINRKYVELVTTYKLVLDKKNRTANIVMSVTIFLMILGSYLYGNQIGKWY